MSYKVYTDKKEIFECKIYLEGASLETAKARLILENSKSDLVFKGKVNKDGVCKVPIKKLRGILDENDNGKLKLEIIADDTYFQPWESDFIVETSKKIKVEFNTNKQKSYPDGYKEVPSKPKMIVAEVKNDFNPIQKISKVLSEKGMTLQTVLKNKKKIIPVLKEYSKKINYKQGDKKFIVEVIKNLPNK